MATVREIRLYPVKGLDPVLVPEARVLASGALDWDRRFAMMDGRGRFVNGKNYAGLHRVRAAFCLGRGEMALDGRGYSLEREGTAVAAWFSERLGTPVEWREAAATGFPDDTVSPGPTIVSQASLEAVARWFGLKHEQVRRRFRANIEVTGLAAFGEDRWYGATVRVGAVEVTVVNPCARCVVPSRDASTGEEEPGFQRRFAELRKQHLPPWAPERYFDHYYRFAVNTRIAAEYGGKFIRLGDEVAAA